MKSLNTIAEDIAFKLGDQFNNTLKESIKLTLLDYRAKYLRDDIDRNYISLNHFTQTMTINFKKVNILEEFKGNEPNCLVSLYPSNINAEEYKILKSEKPVPSAIRTKTSYSNPYIFFGSKTGRVNFIYTTLDSYYYIREINGLKNKVYYTIINNHIYILNNLTILDDEQEINTNNLCSALLTGIFEDPREAYKICSDNNKFIDDNPFPIGLDMLASIRNLILKGEYPLIPTDGQEVNIKKDATDK